MHCSCVAALRDHFGLDRRPVTVHEPYQMLGSIEPDLQDALGIDVAGVFGRVTMFGFPNENWRTWRTPWGQEVLVSEYFQTTTDTNGDVYIYPEGDLNVPPSGHMPRNGYFFDSIIRQEPFDEDRLDVSDNLEEFGPISRDDLEHLRQRVEEARASGRAVVVGLPGTALGDIDLVPAPFLRQPKGIRDVSEWYMSTSVRPGYIRQIFEAQTDIAIQNLQRIYDAVGNDVDVAFVCGTDFGTQTSTFCSTHTFESLWKPYYRQINDWIHAHTTWKTFKHSCGAVASFVPHFIEAGFDILNPVQCSAAGMDPGHLKQSYGDRIVFWGGGVDTQKTLPFGTPEQVEQEVLQRCEIFAPGGGFVFDAVHNIQARTPIENILAMFNALRRFNGEQPVG